MAHSQYTSCGGKRSNKVQDQNLLLKQHPVLLPLLLLLGACLAGITSFSTGDVFPLLTLMGLPSDVLCLSIASVLGISGILVSIINIIECIDQRSIQATLFSEAKEQKLC